MDSDSLPEVDVIFDARPQLAPSECAPSPSVVNCSLMIFTQDHPLNDTGLPRLVFVGRIRECHGEGAALINAVTSPEF